MSSGGWNSLEFKLPLLMSAVLVIVLTIALVVTYTTLARTAVSTATDRLNRATKTLATQAATGIGTQRARYQTAARDSVIRRALLAGTDAGGPSAVRAPTGSALRSALEKLSLPADSGMPVELWTASGKRLGFVGNDVRNQLLLAPGRAELHQPTDPAVVAGPEPKTDSLRIGPLYAEEDRVHFWLVMPVLDKGKALGYIAHQRRIARNPALERTLRDLSGDSVSMYYRNLDGNFWATLSGLPVSPSAAAAPERAGAQDDVLFHEERIAGTPLVIWMDVPRATVLAQPREALRVLALISIVLVIGGAFASWAIGRRIARPLGVMTRAAGALAQGDYGARVPAVGESEVRRLASSFNNMAEEIERAQLALEQQTTEAHSANSAKSEFLTVMSHELRTPLNAIGGYADLMQLGLRGPVTPEQQRDLERIKLSQQHLLGLISGVLDLSRIESGRVSYRPEPVALPPFLTGLDALVGPQAAAKSLKLNCALCDDNIILFTDREKLRQIMLNLLSNAIRHTPAHGSITVSVETRGDQVAIVVEDTGPGIPVDKLEVVFEPFVQLDRSLTQSREGIGLGLAISRDLARGMGGDLMAEPRHGAGARFVLTLPRAEEGMRDAWRSSGEMSAQHRHS